MARRLTVAVLSCIVLLLVGCARPDPPPRPTERPAPVPTVTAPTPAPVKPSPAQVADDLVSQGLHLYVHNDRDAALAKFRAALKLDPTSKDAAYWVGAVTKAKAAVTASNVPPANPPVTVYSGTGYNAAEGANPPGMGRPAVAAYDPRQPHTLAEERVEMAREFRRRASPEDRAVEDARQDVKAQIAAALEKHQEEDRADQ